MGDNRSNGIKRRDFLKGGVIGTTSLFLGGNALAEVVQQYAAVSGSFPDPVFRTLGRTGLKISVVSFGAMLTPEPEVIRVALEHGVNYLDTARKYMNGRNEEIVAKAIKGWRRDKIHLATKTLPESRMKAEIIRDVEASLRALETDYIDVIQLHNLTDKERIFVPETREALLTLKKQGKIRFCGVTTHKNQVEVLNALVDDKERFFDTCLVAYNFKSGKEVGEVIARAAKGGVGIIAMKTQAGGYQTEELGKISPHQAALKWALQNPHVTAAIPGMKDMSQLKEDIAVMGMSFRYADRRILERYGQAVQPYYCHLCGSCEAGCSRGVEISTVNRALMYAEGGYRDRPLASSTYGEIPATATAAACLDCAACTARCVHGLDISAKMERARQVLA